MYHRDKDIPEAVYVEPTLSERQLNCEMYKWFLSVCPQWRLAPVAEYKWKKDSLEVYAHANPTHLVLINDESKENVTLRIDYELWEEDAVDITTGKQLVERVCSDIYKRILYDLDSGTIKGIRLKGAK